MPRATKPTSKSQTGSAAALRKLVGAGATAAPAEKHAEGHETEAPKLPTPRAGLVRTDVDGVYVNEMGTKVDHRGIALSIQKLKAKYNEQAVDVLGVPLRTPLDLLRMVAMDPRVPMHVRIEAAKAATPYISRKMPTAVDGGEDPSNPDGPGLPIKTEVGFGDLGKLSATDLAAFRALMEKTHKE